MPQNSASFRWRKATAAAALIVGAVLIVAAGQNLFIRMAGLGVVLFGISMHANGRRLSGLPTPSRTMWIMGVVSAAAVLAAAHLLYLDALNGSQEVWPVYAFAAAVVFAAGIWAALLARMS